MFRIAQTNKESLKAIQQIPKSLSLLSQKEETNIQRYSNQLMRRVELSPVLNKHLNNQSEEKSLIITRFSISCEKTFNNVN
jgi:hypothetical protein